MKLGIFDPGASLDHALVEMADVAHPETERPAVGIETPGSDHDLARDMAFEARAEQQHQRAILRGALHRLPGRLAVAGQSIHLAPLPLMDSAVEPLHFLLRPRTPSRR